MERQHSTDSAADSTAYLSELGQIRSALLGLSGFLLPLL